MGKWNEKQIITYTRFLFVQNRQYNLIRLPFVEGRKLPLSQLVWLSYLYTKNILHSFLFSIVLFLFCDTVARVEFTQCWNVFSYLFSETNCKYIESYWRFFTKLKLVYDYLIFIYFICLFQILTFNPDMTYWNFHTH